ncbi:MAG TPA: cation diffusion facilitator family transporter [Gemmatimonadales bacterium]|nr:cation diffusion facilitator family transporter [Gemmatimonadales bacterium]
MSRGIQLVRTGLLVNGVLALTKLVAGVLGQSYALIADAVESTADMFSSLVVWSGLRISSRDADQRYPFGYGKAESVSSAIVGLMLGGAAVGIAIEAVREIVTPHHAPAPFTLFVLIAVVIIKESLFRWVIREASDSGSLAVGADAWHHRSDAITSAAAFLGISIAVIGGPGWEPADDWAALFASVVILINGVRIIRPALADLMDVSPDENVFRSVEAAARDVPGVLATEKLRIRKSGTRYLLELHVQADPALSLHNAHILSGMVKTAIRAAVPRVGAVLVHMEPFEGP